MVGRTPTCGTGRHADFRPADYAEMVALPMPSRCGRSEIPRQNPELGISGQSLPVMRVELAGFGENFGQPIRNAAEAAPRRAFRQRSTNIKIAGCAKSNDSTMPSRPARGVMWRHGVWDEMARLDRARRSSRCKSFAVISTYGIVIPGSTPEEIRGQSTKSFALWTKSDTGQATDGTEVFSVSRAKGKTRLQSCGCDQSIG